MIRELVPRDAARAAAFLARTTLVNRWLVALAQHLPVLRPESLAAFGLWVQTAGASGQPEGEPRAVAAHCFETGVTYVALGDGFEAGELEAHTESECLPERLVGDREALRRWEERAPRLFARAAKREELVVLALAPGELRADVRAAGFRKAVPADEPRLRELERLRAREMEEPEESDLTALVAQAMAFVVEEQGSIAGMIRSNLPDGLFVHAGGVYVHPDWRGRRVGTRLVAGLCERIHRQGLRVLLDTARSNRAALATYGAVGFREVGQGTVFGFPGDAWRARG